MNANYFTSTAYYFLALLALGASLPACNTNPDADTADTSEETSGVAEERTATARTSDGRVRQVTVRQQGEMLQGTFAGRTLSIAMNNVNVQKLGDDRFEATLGGQSVVLQAKANGVFELAMKDGLTMDVSVAAGEPFDDINDAAISTGTVVVIIIVGILVWDEFVEECLEQCQQACASRGGYESCTILPFYCAATCNDGDDGDGGDTCPYPGGWVHVREI